MGENYFGITDAGKQRTNNEDSFIAKTVNNKDIILACVIDGVGGYAGGEIAAQITSEEIIRELGKLPGDMIEHMVIALGNANERIIREKETSAENEKMACVVTLAVVDLQKNLFYFAHVGDTRLYLFRDGSLIKITKDHSAVGFLEESGRITEEAAMVHPKRNEVNKVLGYEPRIALNKDFIDTGESPFLPGDSILICSDGLTDMIPASRIISILNGSGDLPAKGKLLIDAANDAGGKDNITVVLVQNNKSRQEHSLTKPLAAQKKNNHAEAVLLKDIEKTGSGEMPVLKNNNSRGINRLLLFFCALFLFGFTWMAYVNYYGKADTASVIPPLVSTERNQPEIDFADSINAATDKIVTLAGKQPIVISKAILFKNDSLRILGNGMAFVRDSAYSGPAFILSPNCKYILLDSLVIDGFDVGISVLNKGLHLRNVQFRNCIVPVQFHPQLPHDTLLSGTQAETVFYYKDSLRR